MAGARTKCDYILNHCLYFTANSLARLITRMAEEEFSVTGISPSHAYLMMLVNQNPGITQNELAQKLALAPSTVTRFVDALAQGGYLARKVEGRESHLYATDRGLQLQDKIDAAWQALYQRYTAILGQEQSAKLAEMIDEATRKLEA